MLYNTSDTEEKELIKKNLLLQITSFDNINNFNSEIQEEVKDRNKKFIKVFNAIHNFILEILITVLMEDKQI